MPLTLEEAIRQINNNVDTMPKAIPMSQAEQIDTTESILNAIPDYRDNKIERFAKGLYSGLDTVRDVLPAIELFGRNADLAIGGYFGASEEEVSRKTMNIATIQRNLMANQKDRNEYTSTETADSWAFGIGQGAANLLMMYASGGAAGAIVKGTAAKAVAGIVTGTALENVEQQSERIPVNELGELEVDRLTPQWAKKSTIGATAYLAASALLEKYVGFGKQTTLWETPIKFSNKTLKNISPTLKTAGKGFLSEGVTEGLQSLTSSGILLAEGTIKMSDMTERLQQAWKEAVIGGILGGSVGTAVAINQQHNVKTMLNEEIGKVVTDPNEREAIVEAIYESGTVEMTNVISKELELSSELNTKHGAIYDSMQNAIHSAIKESGAFEQEAETDLAQYVSETSKMFANQVLAEANKRGCLIDDVLKASDIKYENGMIKLQAGNEVIAETPIAQEEVKMDENGQTKLFQAAAMYKERDAQNIKEFYNKVQKVPDDINKVKYSIPNKKLSIPASAMHHANTEHSLTDADWENVVNNIDNIFIAGETDEANAYSKENYRVGIKTGNKYYGLIIGVENKDNYIATVFPNTQKGVEAWVNEKGKTPSKVHSGKPAEAPLSKRSSNDIITYLKENLNPVILFQSANTAGANTAELSDAQREWQEKGTESKYFKRYTDNAPLIKSEDAQNYDFKDGEKIALQLFHGTRSKIEIFDKSKAGKSNKMGKIGFWFSDRDNFANNFANNIWWGEEQEAITMPVYVTLKKPKVYKQKNVSQEEYDKARNKVSKIRKEFDDLTEEFKQLWEETGSWLQARETISIKEKETQKRLKEAEAELAELTYTDSYEQLRTDVYKFAGKNAEDANFGGLGMALNNEDEAITNFVNSLKEQGYDGIIIQDTRFDADSAEANTNNQYVAFYPEQIKSVDNRGTFDAQDPNIYYQLKNNPKEPKKARGAYNVSKKAIELFKDADYSTLPHEMAHFWLDNMWSYSRSGLASDAYKNNFQAVLDFLGVKDNQIYLTRAQQEKFARAYEKYLLNGYAPNGLIQGAFDDYDRWLQKVYKDARELKVKLTADAIEFFDSMTTGQLQPYTVEETNREVIEKEVVRTVKEAKKVATQTNAAYSASPMINSTVPVETEGEKAQSRVYTNQAGILDLAEELDYNKVNIEEQNAKAKAFVKSNLAAAQRIVNGLEQPPADILKNAIYNAYLKEMLAIGNTDAYVQALRNQSLELTRAGQEIASQRGAIENIFDSTYWIRRIENRLKEIKAVEKFGAVADGMNESNAVKRLNEYIDTEIEKVLDKFVNATAEEQAEIVKKLVDNVSAELNSKPPEELYQRLREPAEVRTRTNAYNYLYRAVNEGLGLSLSNQQVNEIINKTSAIQKSIENTKDRNGNPSALFFKNMAEMENYANSIAPSPALSVLTSTIGRGNMLMSPKSIALNIESNILNFISESIIKRISYGAVDKVVDINVIKEYLEYSKGVFNSSGYQISTMEELDATQRILSEKQITSQGEGIIRAIGRFYEQTIFKYGLGYPDLIFKDLAFVDSINLLASKEAKGDAKKATAIFKDAILLEPKTIQGREIRAKAQIDALVATYQNKSALSEAALTVRNALNKWSGKLKLGDALNPFVKTPANVLALGIDYTFGAYALKDIQTIVSDFQRGQITDTSKNALRKIGRNAIGVLIAFALSSLIDDDDYIPDYALLSPSERNLVKAQNGVFNAVKIGNKWVNLDYFGPFAMPLAAVLNAKKEKALQDKVFNYLTGAGIQGLKIPVFGNLAETFQTAGRLANQDATKGAEELINSLVDFTSSRLTPAILSDIAKITDDYERDTGKSALNRAMTRIPVLREQLPAKVNYATGRAVETESALSVLLSGARIKEATKGSVIREIDKLSKADTKEKVTLASITKGRGDLSKLPESEKPKVEAKFARMYSQDVAKLIKTNAYHRLDDENKVKAINKIRDKAVESLKREYGLGKKRSKQ